MTLLDSRETPYYVSTMKFFWFAGDILMNLYGMATDSLPAAVVR